MIYRWRGHRAYLPLLRYDISGGEAIGHDCRYCYQISDNKTIEYTLQVVKYNKDGHRKIVSNEMNHNNSLRKA